MRKKILKKSDKRRPLKEIGLFLADILYNAVIIIVLVVLIRSFLISPFRVIGSSMADTLKNNEFILINKLNYHLGEPKRGDPIVFLPPITNKYSEKFEESLMTDSNGNGMLDISELTTKKNVFYCQNPWIQKMWFCKDRVDPGDLVYFRPVGDKNDLSWRQAEKKVVSREEVKQKKLVLSGMPGQSYMLRIYNSSGPEYFVKRVIGIPGDKIRIENGRVYFKSKDTNEFNELDEVYLNDENQFNTYFKKNPDLNEFEVPEGHYFVLGDNRGHSNDSRHWFSPIDEQFTPYVSEENISGKVLIVLWPPTNLRLISAGMLED